MCIGCTKPPMGGFVFGEGSATSKLKCDDDMVHPVSPFTKHKREDSRVSCQGRPLRLTFLGEGGCW